MPSLETGRSPDGRYFVVRGRLWRCTNPALPDDERKRLTSMLMTARRNRRAWTWSDVWWDDGAPDYNRKMARNSTYAAWYAAIKTGEPDPCAVASPIHLDGGPRLLERFRRRPEPAAPLQHRPDDDDRRRQARCGRAPRAAQHALGLGAVLLEQITKECSLGLIELYLSNDFNCKNL